MEEHPRRIRDVINTVHYVRVKHEMARRGEPVTDPADPALVVKIDKVRGGHPYVNTHEEAAIAL